MADSNHNIGDAAHNAYIKQEAYDASHNALAEQHQVWLQRQQARRQQAPSPPQSFAVAAAADPGRAGAQELAAARSWQADEEHRGRKRGRPRDGGSQRGRGGGGGAKAAPNWYCNCGNVLAPEDWRRCRECRLKGPYDDAMPQDSQRLQQPGPLMPAKSIVLPQQGFEQGQGDLLPTNDMETVRDGGQELVPRQGLLATQSGCDQANTAVGEENARQQRMLTEAEWAEVSAQIERDNATFMRPAAIMRPAERQATVKGRSRGQLYEDYPQTLREHAKQKVKVKPKKKLKGVARLPSPGVPLTKAQRRRQALDRSKDTVVDFPCKKCTSNGLFATNHADWECLRQSKKARFAASERHEERLQIAASTLQQATTVGQTGTEQQLTAPSTTLKPAVAPTREDGVISQVGGAVQHPQPELLVDWGAIRAGVLQAQARILFPDVSDDHGARVNFWLDAGLTSCAFMALQLRLLDWHNTHH